MANLIENFYNAFQDLDAETMVALYHPDIIFKDPALGVLEGEKAKNMWRMLCLSQKGKDFSLRVTHTAFDENQGRANWEATYTFSKTGRKVHNIIQADFTCRDGKIMQHTDHFDLYRWSKQALGLPGYLMGWTPYFKQKLNKQTQRMLANFEAQL